MLAILKHHFGKTTYFILIWGIFILIGLFGLAYLPKVDIFQLVNGKRNWFLDKTMPIITHFGDYISVLAMVFILLLNKKRNWALALFANSLVITVVVQLMKNFAFAPNLRPLAYLATLNKVPITVAGIDLHSFNSFPSGHTAQGFTLFFMLSLFVDQKKWQPFFAIMAILVGYSRVYLGQHFVADVIFSAVITVPINLLLYSYYKNKGISL